MTRTPKLKITTNSLAPRSPLSHAVIVAAAERRANPNNKRACESLAKAMRALVYRAAKCILKDSRAEDVASEATMLCLAALDEGRVSEGKESSYALRAAHNRAVSTIRSEWGFALAPDDQAMDAWLAARADASDFETSSPCAETLALDAEFERDRQRDIAFLLTVIDEAPDAMQEFLRARLSGLTTQEVVVLHVTSVNFPSPQARATFEKRLRARLDQRYARAKSWINHRFATGTHAKRT